MSSTPQARGPDESSRRNLDRPIDPRMDPQVARSDAVDAERRAFGGVKIGSAFFGWLTAMGMAVLLTALLAAAGAAVGVAGDAGISQAAGTGGHDAGTVGIVGVIALGVILFVAYYCGGYVAGRMARFNGVTQGTAVWLWAVVIAVVVAVVGAIAGSRYNVLQQLNSFPRIPVSEGELTTAGLSVLVVVAVTSLIGAMLGGLAGMHYHRKIDRARLTI